VGNTVLRSGEQAELALEAQSVPRIDQCAALNGARTTLSNSDEHLRRAIELPGLSRQLSGREPALDLTRHPRCRHRHHLRFSQSCLGIAHAGTSLDRKSVV